MICVKVIQEPAHLDVGGKVLRAPAVMEKAEALPRERTYIHVFETPAGFVSEVAHCVVEVRGGV